MYLSATLDHFGYAIPKLEMWKDDLWYNKHKFDDWFQALRNRRRTREIMPHISVDSDTDDDDDDHSFMSDDRPPSPGGDGAEGNASGDGQHPDDGAPAGPSHLDSEVGSGPTQDQVNHVGDDSSINSEQVTSEAGTIPGREQPIPSGEQLLRAVSLSSDDSVLILDSMGNILGSYDKVFPFKNWNRLVPCNPYAFCKDMTSTDFELGGLYDPRSEDIGNIINVAARGQHTKDYQVRLLNLEDYAYIMGQVPSPGIVRYLTTKLLTYPETIEHSPFKRPRLELKYPIEYIPWTGSNPVAPRFPIIPSTVSDKWPKTIRPIPFDSPETRPQSPVPKFMADLAATEAHDFP